MLIICSRHTLFKKKCSKKIEKRKDEMCVEKIGKTFGYLKIEMFFIFESKYYLQQTLN